MAPPEDPFDLVGRSLEGRFDIESVVARGGFGVVYRGVQRAIGRRVAVKVLDLPPNQSGSIQDEVLASFHAEARISAELAHPSIVQVVDFGVAQLANGATAPWMAMEWLDGESLEVWMDARRAAGPLCPADALALLRPVFDALRIAHARGVVHRDLKPANIMRVRLADGSFTLKLLDFGIARLVDPEAAVAGSGQTSTNTFGAFSPCYAAPEQVGRARTGPWTDVHAMGLILTELLTAQNAYDGEDLTTLIAAALAQPRPTPARFGIDVGAWEAVLARAVAFRPDQRYPDAKAFVAALDATVERASPRPDTTLPDAPRQRAPRRSSAWAVALVSLAGLTAVVAWRLRAHSPAAPLVIPSTPSPPIVQQPALRAPPAPAPAPPAVVAPQGPSEPPPAAAAPAPTDPPDGRREHRRSHRSRHAHSESSAVPAVLPAPITAPVRAPDPDRRVTAEKQ